MKENDSPIIKGLFVIGGIVFLALTVGFFWQMEWATSLWLWPDGRLSYIFIASITAAIGVPLIWIGLSGEFGAARGGAINLGITALGTAIYLFYYYGQTGEPYILISAVIAAIGVPVNVAIFLWSNKIPIKDQRAMPGLVKISFAFFGIVLIVVSLMLILRAPVIFPWPLNPNSSVIFGLIFLGAAFYFLSALQIPLWHSARGQLLGFLAYDLVLFGPFLAHLSSVMPEHRLSLILYILVLVYSGALAVTYLFINKTTRPWGIQTEVSTINN